MIVFLYKSKNKEIRHCGISTIIGVVYHLFYDGVLVPYIPKDLEDDAQNIISGVFIDGDGVFNNEDIARLKTKNARHYDISEGWGKLLENVVEYYTINYTKSLKTQKDKKMYGIGFTIRRKKQIIENLNPKALIDFENRIEDFRERFEDRVEILSTKSAYYIILGKPNDGRIDEQIEHYRFLNRV